MPACRWMIAMVLLILSPACSWPTSWDGAETLHIRADPPNLVLSNRAERPIYYFAFEEETAALSLFGACEDPESCAHVLQGQTIRLPYDSIAGYDRGAEVALVYWWHLVPARGGGTRLDKDMRVERIRLQ